jgi:hypothetical protein
MVNLPMRDGLQQIDQASLYTEGIEKCSDTVLTEWGNRVVSTHASYSGCPGLKISARRLAIQTGISRHFPQRPQANF